MRSSSLFDLPARRALLGRLRPAVLAMLVIALIPITLAAAPARAVPALPSPSTWPLAGSPSVIRGYDPPISAWGPGHRGVDLAGSAGSPVLAAAAGTITYAGLLAGRGVVVVDHGAVRTTYEPVAATVSVGDQVGAGEQIGTLRPGHCSGPTVCLHWGLRAADSYLNPLLLVPGQPGAAVTSGEYRLLGAADRQQVQQRIAARQDQLTMPGIGSTGGTGTLAGPAGSHGFGFPVAAPITSGYGMRFHPILHVTKLHDGTDFGAACGTPIRAPYAGTVSQAYFNAGYGNRLMVDHGVVDGIRVVSGFNHAASYVVGVGDRVSKGQLLGYVGTTGYSTGCHLHLMVWLNGKLVNPMSWY